MAVQRGFIIVRQVKPESGPTKRKREATAFENEYSRLFLDKRLIPREMEVPQS